MKKTVAWIAGMLVLILLIVGAYILYTTLSEHYTPDNLAQEQESETYLAPDFTVFDKNGDAVKLSSMRGKPVVINFWASWCPPCKAEMPDFEEMYKKYGSDVHFMIINVTDGHQETEASARAHLDASGYTFPVYFDTSLHASNVYQVATLPMTFFIDAEGKLVTYAQGMISASLLEKGIGMIK